MSKTRQNSSVAIMKKKNGAVENRKSNIDVAASAANAATSNMM